MQRGRQRGAVLEIVGNVGRGMVVYSHQATDVDTDSACSVTVEPSSDFLMCETDLNVQEILGTKLFGNATQKAYRN